MALHARLLVMLSIISILDTILSDVDELCNWQTFHGQCAETKVMVVHQARYGRMRLGRCVKEQFGYLGCEADVRPFVDRQCSGKNSCTLDIYKAFREIRPCSELEAYLEVHYECVQVTQFDTLECTSSGSVTLTGSEGFIASETVQRSALWRNGCPLQLRAKVGQRWNITLLDFGIDLPNDNSMVADGNIPVCRKYAVLREADGQETVVCGGDIRQKNVYISDANTLDVELVPLLAGSDTRHFLIKYEVLGCEIPRSPNVIHLRSGGAVSHFRCNITGSTWEMKCVGNTWQGHHPACNPGAEAMVAGENWTLWKVITDDWMSPSGLLIVTGLGVALGILIGGLLLTCAVIYYKKRRQQHDRDINNTELGPKEGYTYAETPVGGTRHSGTDASMPTKVASFNNRRPSNSNKSGHYGYNKFGYRQSDTGTTTSTCDEDISLGERVVTSLPPPPPLYSLDSSGYGSYGRSLHPTEGVVTSEHLYEIPN